MIKTIDACAPLKTTVLNSRLKSSEIPRHVKTKISKRKKQFVHLSGVAGGDFDHWDAGGVGFASD